MGLPLALEAETRKWFPASNSSHDVRNALVSACTRAPFRARILYNTSVEALAPLKAGGWACRLADRSELAADRVVPACHASMNTSQWDRGCCASVCMLRRQGP